MKKLLTLFFLLYFPLIALPIHTAQAAKQSWQSWVKDLRKEAVSEGIDPQLFDQVFQNIRPRPKVIRLDRRQPEKRLTFLEYRKSRIDPYRIKLGAREYKKHKTLINNISHDYGVSACFIVALWGIESSYGRFMGNFPVVSSLATLAYDNRRGDFFRRELLYALHILNEGHIQPHNFKGEWAGGTGQPQFLPSSWHNFAVDHNNDGKKDIWKHYGDIFASIANYLVQNGWQTGEPWGLAVNIPGHISHSLLTLKRSESISAWRKQGVTLLPGESWPSRNLQASLIEPNGGPGFLVFNNFKVIMKWNRSTFYAASVGYLADEICERVT